MSTPVFVHAHNIISPLGVNSIENYQAVISGKTGITAQQRFNIDKDTIYASLFDVDFFKTKLDSSINPKIYTQFEQLCIASVKDTLSNASIKASDPQTVFILSTTKGNIALMENKDELSFTEVEAINLFHSAQKIATYFHNNNRPIVISNACISGVAALIYAKRLLDVGRYEHAIVIGADLITKFVYSGFKSFNALASGNCKPFSSARNGINLGEAVASVLVSRYKNNHDIQFLSGSITNDANHISGPSKTGEELCLSISKTLAASQKNSEDVDFISAHGTATLYNDEMEAKAFNSAGLNQVPLNSLKGYFGHTLGTAGVIESVISIMALQQNVMIPTLGYHELGVTTPVNVCSKLENKEVNTVLKTASGFGGCNASVLFSKQ